MKLIYQPLGTVILIGIESKDQQKIKEQYYSFWNHGATEGKLHWLCDTFAYITTHEEELKKYFLNSSLHTVLNSHPNLYKKTKGGAMNRAKELAKERLDELKSNHEVFINTNPLNYDYSLGRIEAKRVFSSTQVFDEEGYKQGYSKTNEQNERIQTDLYQNVCDS